MMKNIRIRMRIQITDKDIKASISNTNPIFLYRDEAEVEHVAQHIHCISLALYHVQKVDTSAFLSAPVLNCVGHLVK